MKGVEQTGCEQGQVKTCTRKNPEYFGVFCQKQVLTGAVVRLHGFRSLLALTFQRIAFNLATLLQVHVPYSELASHTLCQGHDSKSSWPWARCSRQSQEDSRAPVHVLPPLR